MTSLAEQWQEIVAYLRGQSEPAPPARLSKPAPRHEPREPLTRAFSDELKRRHHRRQRNKGA